jgi:hypothetical protein
MRAKLRSSLKKPGAGAWALFYLGRFLQVLGLVITLFAATAFFGTPSTIAMLRMMLIGVCVFVPGWLLARKEPSRS